VLDADDVLTECALYVATSSEADARIENADLGEGSSVAWTWFASVEQSDLDEYVPEEPEEPAEEPEEEEEEDEGEDMSARVSASILTAAAVAMITM